MKAIEKARSALGALRELVEASAGEDLPVDVITDLRAVVEQLGAVPDELVITLRKPVSLGGVEYTQVKLREPTAGEFGQAEMLNGMKSDAMAIAAVSGMPPAAAEMIGIRDFNRAARYIARFFA